MRLRPTTRLRLLPVVLAACSSSAAMAGPTVLQNGHLTATFADSPAGPRLASIEHGATGEAYRFDRAEEVVLAVVRPRDVHDPACRVKYELQDAFRFEDFAVEEDRRRATMTFGHDSLRVQVAYELTGDALRKTVTCTAGDAGAYVAGVNLWLVKPLDRPLAWPKSGTLGQPAVLLGRKGGCFFTLEWPMAKVASLDGDVRLAYRPGYELSPGESRQVAAGSIGFFSGADLESARQAFFAHVADRAKPALPFPVKFTTWGPWLGQARADRILETVDDMAYVGVDLLHFDAGWQHPDHPYSRRLPRIEGASDEAWDRAVTQPERLPKGLLPIVRAANKRGMKVSLWFDACGHVFVYEGQKWAIRNKAGEPVLARTWEGRKTQATKQSLATQYGDRLRDFVLEAMDRYDLGGIMFDNNHYAADFGPGRRSLANGWNAVDVQLRQIVEIFDEAERRRPGIYRFFCVGKPWPWALLHATHIHAGDPGTAPAMREAMATDYPARALAFERRLAWQRLYDNFVPPWGIKGDVAGWSTQQGSPIPINLDHTDELIPAGEGWTQNMFTCFATTAVRDVRFSFRQMPAFDRDVLQQWLAWDRRRTRFILNCRPLFRQGPKPNEAIVGYSHVGGGQGVLYFFNTSFEPDELEVRLDEAAGFRPADKALPAFIVYPMAATLGSGRVSYGDTLRVPLIGKDCLVIEIGLDPPDSPVPYADYRRIAGTVRRSFETVQLATFAEVLRAAAAGPLRVEVGHTPQDRRLANQITEAISAAAGHPVGDCPNFSEGKMGLPPSSSATGKGTRSRADVRLLIGTHDGLADHAEIGERFRQTLYSRYLACDGRLLSAPVVCSLPEAEVPTYGFLAPRPEQLARLAINLVQAVTAEAEVLATAERFVVPPSGGKRGAPPEGGTTNRAAAEQAFTVDVPPGRTALRFRPLMGASGHVPIPNVVDRYRYQIEAERDGRRTVIWRENIPPFLALGGRQWWDDRVIPTAHLAGGRVTFHLTAEPTNGRGHPRLHAGFDHLALLRLTPVR